MFRPVVIAPNAVLVASLYFEQLFLSLLHLYLTGQLLLLNEPAFLHNLTRDPSVNRIIVAALEAQINTVLIVAACYLITVGINIMQRKHEVKVLKPDAKSIAKANSNPANQQTN